MMFVFDWMVLQYRYKPCRSYSQKKVSEIQRIMESSCTRKETVGGDILMIFGNSDKKVTQPIRITSETTLLVHFFQKLLANVM